MAYYMVLDHTAHDIAVYISDVHISMDIFLYTANTAVNSYAYISSEHIGFDNRMNMVDIAVHMVLGIYDHKTELGHISRHNLDEFDL